VLRDEWLFKGFVTSDWLWGLHDGAKGIIAGLDVEMPLSQRYRKKKIQKLLDAKTISMAQIDEIVRRVVRTKLLYITKTDPQVYPKTLLAHAAHQQLALEVAEKSMVLLKNKNNLLPLAADQIKDPRCHRCAGQGREYRGQGKQSYQPTSYHHHPAGFATIQQWCFQGHLCHDGKDVDAARKIAWRMLMPSFMSWGMRLMMKENIQHHGLRKRVKKTGARVAIDLICSLSRKNKSS
jgi:beta-glucosidase-like glycosyl hydrolase